MKLTPDVVPQEKVSGNTKDKQITFALEKEHKSQDSILNIRSTTVTVIFILEELNLIFCYSKQLRSKLMANNLLIECNRLEKTCLHKAREQQKSLKRSRQSEVSVLLFGSTLILTKTL